jgi:hypothetical protein
MSVFVSAIAGVAILSSSSNDHPTAKKFVVFVGLAQPQVCLKILMCNVVFVCTTPWSSGDSVYFLNTGLKQRPHKQERLLVLIQEQNEMLHNNIESSREKHVAQY